MSITARDLDALAQAIVDAKESAQCAGVDSTSADLVALYLTGPLRRSNPRFDGTRWLRACGIPVADLTPATIRRTVRHTA